MGHWFSSVRARHAARVGTVQGGIAPAPNQRAWSKLVVARHNGVIGAPASPLTALVARIDRDDLAEVMLSTFRNEIPGYARLPDAMIRGEVLKIIRENVDICLDWVAGRPAPGPRRFENFRVSAQNRAAEGMPLEDLLRAYRRGGTAAWRVIVAAATPDEREALPRAAELVMDYLDLVSGTVAAAYLEEREHHVSEQERGLRALLDALLRGEALAPPTTRPPSAWASRSASTSPRSR